MPAARAQPNHARAAIPIARVARITRTTNRPRPVPSPVPPRQRPVRRRSRSPPDTTRTLIGRRVGGGGGSWASTREVCPGTSLPAHREAGEACEGCTVRSPSRQRTASVDYTESRPVGAPASSAPLVLSPSDRSAATREIASWRFRGHSSAGRAPAWQAGVRVRVPLAPPKR